MMVTKFKDNFWGEGNQGFQVLFQNMKAGVTASKELGDFIKERLTLEDSYLKGLTKLHKSVVHISGINLGGFTPLWEVITEMCEQVTNVHSKYVKMFSEMSREMTEYNILQRDKLKANLKGEVELAQDSLVACERAIAALQRTKSQYQLSVDHLAKAQAKQRKILSDPTVNIKTKSQVESRLNQAQVWMETMKNDHQAATKLHCEHVMDFQGKMVEACQKFESLEEEHLAQMATFMIKIAKTLDTHHLLTERVLAKMNEQLEVMSVEYLLDEFVRNKGTGRDKPVPYKFKPVEVPTHSIGVLTVNAEAEVQPSNSSTGTTSKTLSKGEGLIKSFLKKRKPKPTTDVRNDSPQLERVDNVDEEGYSIRPEDASSISHFPGGSSPTRDYSGSDSDFENESGNGIRMVTIRESADKPQATVDDIKASVVHLQLHSEMKSATSSQSLNFLATPPTGHKNFAASSSQDISQQSDKTGMMSLLDIDSQLNEMPPPLLPQVTLHRPLHNVADQGEIYKNMDKNYSPQSSEATRPQQSNHDPNISTLPLSSADQKVSEPVVQLPTLQPSKIVNRAGSFGSGSLRTFQSIDQSALDSQTFTPKQKKNVMLPPPPQNTLQYNTSTTTTTRPRRPNHPVVDRAISPVTPAKLISVNPTSMEYSKLCISSSSISSIPLAIAFRETCNAKFSSTKDCVSKVTGEVVMSFPAAFLSQLARSEPLTFKLENFDGIERSLHNQVLLKRDPEDCSQFIINMAALLSHLKVINENHASQFYNVQLVKYELKQTVGTNLPLKLVCYWKCDGTVTNFRLDCCHMPLSMKSLGGQKVPVTNLTISVPVNGGVRNALSKPTGQWSSEQNEMVWKFTKIQAGSSESLHAKFDLANGPSDPSPVVAKFECDGATMSGLTLRLCSDGYKLSLIKNICIAGQYSVE